MLIVEGTDCVGKTTLCKKLIDKLSEHGPWVYSHFTRLPDTWHFPGSFVPHVFRHVVRDRFHMSEIVYNQARGDPQQRLRHEEYRWLDGLIRTVGGFTVIVVASSTFINDHYTSAGQMYPVEVCKRANKAYERIVLGLYAPYSPDFDYVVRVDRAYCGDTHVQNIVTSYLARQRWLEESAPERGWQAVTRA